MRSQVVASSLAALALVAAPVAANAAPVERVSAPVSEESELGNRSIIWIIIGIAAVIGAILIFDGDNDPVSP